MKVEFWSKEKIAAFQEIKLKETLNYVNENSAFYKRQFKDFDLNSINALTDLQKLPFTTKEDLQQYNSDFLCVPLNKVVDYATTSGTSGTPVSFALTDSDLERIGYNEAESLKCSGIEKGDVVQLMTTIDRQFMAGLAYFLGLRKLGATVIRVGAGIPELQWDAILRYKPAYLITVPSFLIKMIDYAENVGIDYKNCGIKGAVCIGEPLRQQDFSPNNITSRILSRWDLKLYSTYASTEMSTAFAECSAMQGGHHLPELIIVEIIDENGNLITDGSPGELVVTTLGVEAMPLVRFKTGDIVQAHEEECTCGRTTLRLGPVIGRKQQMIKYKGTTLYPPAMNNLLNGFDQIQNHLIEISTNELGTDEITLYLAVQSPTDEFLTQIRDHFRAKLRVSPRIEFLPLEVLNEKVFLPKSRKPRQFIDLR
ncbi:phenylacetate--CoA ligase family protein [Leadbetterella byssophila]|uniref:phenylacetate--CoA ligase family protein n=1 Tax=Leadbetterella byssophila TaxID=316068 RepID=UPI00399F774D